MRGFSRFLGKEATEILRTWRIWVLPGAMLFFAITGPILAQVMPQLVKSLASGQQGMTITLPPPTYLDAYAQWIKNLGQTGLFLLIGVSAGVIAGERSSGTAALVLTKPLSRGGFVVAKYLAQGALLVAATTLGTLVTWGLTVALFTKAPPERLVTGTAAWLALALLLLAVVILCSCVMSTLAALAAGFGAYALLGIATLWGPAVRYSPVGLLGAPAKLLAGEAVDLTWPFATAAGVTLLLVAASVWLFRRVEI